MNLQNFKVVNKKHLSTSFILEFNHLLFTSFKSSRIDDYETIVYLKKDDCIIAFAGLYYIQNCLSINQLCVHPNHRNQGIATNLLNFICDTFKDTILILYIDKNKPMTSYLYNFYLKNGFQEIKEENHNLPYDKKKEFLLFKIVI